MTRKSLICGACHHPVVDHGEFCEINGCDCDLGEEAAADAPWLEEPVGLLTLSEAVVKIEAGEPLIYAETVKLWGET